MTGIGSHGPAFAIQLAKCLHQLALDKGDWQNGLLLLPAPDALSAPSLGGEEAELAVIQSYREAFKRKSGEWE
jgi:hypothetical protein